MKNTVCLFVITLGLTLQLYAQDTLRFNMFELIQLTRESSTAWREAETRKENYYWQYRSMKADYNPQLSFSGNMFQYDRSINENQQDDGSIIYQELSQNRSSVGVGISQIIAPTGGRVYLSSSVVRFDDFIRDDFNYISAPLTINFEQSFFRYNWHRWRKKIEPLKYEERQKNYFVELETISRTVINKYFQLLRAQANLDLASIDVRNNEKLFQKALVEYDSGLIGEDQILRLESNLLSSELKVSEYHLSVENATLDLKTFVNIESDAVLRLDLPNQLPNIKIDEGAALLHAHNNRPDTRRFERKQIEAERDVAKAKGDNGVNFDLNGRFGLNKSAKELDDLYYSPDNQQYVQLSMNVPIMDWGRQKARIKTARANQKLIQYQIEQEKIQFEQNILRTVRNFNTLKHRAEIALRSNELQQRKYELTLEQFYEGTASINTLNLSMKDKDEARRDYIKALGDYWWTYFEIRRLTLFDFEQQKLLVRDLEL